MATALQEPKTAYLKKAWVGLNYHATYSTYAHGVSILDGNLCHYNLLKSGQTERARYVIVHANLYDKIVVLVGIYFLPLALAQILHVIMQLVVQLLIQI